MLNLARLGKNYYFWLKQDIEAKVGKTWKNQAKLGYLGYIWLNMI